MAAALLTILQSLLGTSLVCLLVGLQINFYCFCRSLRPPGVFGVCYITKYKENLYVTSDRVSARVEVLVEMASLP